MSSKSKRKIRKPPSKKVVEVAMQREIVRQVLNTPRFNQFFAHNYKVSFEVRHESRQVFPVVTERPSIELEELLREVWDELGLTDEQMTAGIAAVRNIAAWGQPPPQESEEQSAGDTGDPEPGDQAEPDAPGAGVVPEVPEGVAAVPV